jgi:hypothetical protein
VLVAHHFQKYRAHLVTAMARLDVINLARRSSLEAGSTREKKAGKGGDAEGAPCGSLPRKTGNANGALASFRTGERSDFTADKAATLPQQEKNNSTDVQRGGFKSRGDIPSASFYRLPIASWRARHRRRMYLTVFIPPALAAPNLGVNLQRPCRGRSRFG